jgi:hypothetical protein
MHALSIALAAATVVAVAACAQPSQSTAVTAPTASPPPSAAVSTPAPAAAPATSASSASADAQPDAGASTSAGAALGPGDADAGAAAQFRACAMDSDCVAVDRVACCHNGWKDAVAVSQKDAYAKSFTCPQAHPICPMYLVKDPRVPLCDNATHLCTMVRAEDVACGGFIRNRHACPTGYRCQLPKHPDVAGKCVAP